MIRDVPACFLLLLLLLLPCLVACNTKESRGKENEKPGAPVKQEPPAASAAAEQPPGDALPVGVIGKKEDKDPRELVLLCMEAMGGKKKIDSIKAVSARTTIKGTYEYETRHVVRYPSELLIDYFSAGAPVKSIILDGKSAYLLAPGGITEMKDANAKGVLTSLQADTIHLLQAASGPGADLVYLGETQVAGQEADVVNLTIPELTDIMFFIDRATRMFLGSQYVSPMGRTTVIVSDYRDVGGIMVAHRSQVYVGGSMIVSTIDELAFNPKIPPETFLPEKHPFYKSVKER